MPRTTHESITIQFGDCDPAGIVFFPNYSRWMDAASLSYFRQCGVAPWRELARTSGIIGTPVLEIGVRYLKTASYGDVIRIATQVDEWRARTFVQVHRVTRAQPDGSVDLLCEGREVRAFVRLDDSSPNRIRTVPIPEDIRALCS